MKYKFKNIDLAFIGELAKHSALSSAGPGGYVPGYENVAHYLCQSVTRHHVCDDGKGCKKMHAFLWDFFFVSEVIIKLLMIGTETLIVEVFTEILGLINI